MGLMDQLLAQQKEAQRINDRNARAWNALVGLYEYIMDENEDPSGADQCAALYEILGTFGMVVP